MLVTGILFVVVAIKDPTNFSVKRLAELPDLSAGERNRRLAMELLGLHMTTTILHYKVFKWELSVLVLWR